MVAGAEGGEEIRSHVRVSWMKDRLCKTEINWGNKEKRVSSLKGETRARWHDVGSTYNVGWFHPYKRYFQEML